MRKLDEILNSLRAQKRALILGSIFVDLLINCPQLPKSGADSTAWIDIIKTKKFSH